MGCAVRLGWHVPDTRVPQDKGGGKSKGGVSNYIERERMRLAILEEASVVCSTLSFAGHPMFQRLTRK